MNITSSYSSTIKSYLPRQIGSSFSNQAAFKRKRLINDRSVVPRGIALYVREQKGRDSQRMKNDSTTFTPIMRAELLIHEANVLYTEEPLLFKVVVEQLLGTLALSTDDVRPLAQLTHKNHSLEAIDSSTANTRPYGMAKGKLVISDTFDAPMTIDELTEFLGE